MDINLNSTLVNTGDHASLSPDFWMSPDLPVSISPFGNCVSTYRQLMWDYSSHVPSNKTEGKINFHKQPYLSSGGFLADTKHILWSLISKHFNSKGFHTPSSYLGWASVLYHMSLYCSENNTTIRQCLSIKEELLNFLSTSCPSSRRMVAFSMMGLLFRIDPVHIGCVTVDPSSLTPEAEQSSAEEQTLVIPSRVLFHCIQKTQTIAQDFLNIATRLKTLTISLHEAASHFSGKITSSNAPKVPQEDFDQLVCHLGLSQLSVKYKWSNPVQFAKYLTMVQFSCKTLIHIYSGMRDDEAYSLFPGCYVNKTVDGHTGYWLQGLTTKGYGRRRSTAWVTSDSISVAVQASTSINEWICEACKIGEQIPIFSNVSYFAFSMSHNRTSPDKNGYKLANLTHFRFNYVFDNSDFLISEEDLEEVKFIEYSRNWDSEAVYRIGVIWHFTTHQFRRSLAYYSIESGLVRFTALHNQLQHQRMRMTVHYTKGGQYADSLISSSPTHFKHDLAIIKPIVNALDYVKTIQLSSEQLIGGHGKHVEKHIKPKGSTVIISSRTQTVEKISKGLISYTPKPTGGCMSSTVCHQNLIHPLSACLSCAESALLPSRLKLAITSFERFMDSLQADSPEHVSARSEFENALKILNNRKVLLENI